jgi:hypothetical protein
MKRPPKPFDVAVTNDEIDQWIRENSWRNPTRGECAKFLGLTLKQFSSAERKAMAKLKAIVLVLGITY